MNDTPIPARWPVDIDPNVHGEIARQGRGPVPKPIIVPPDDRDTCRSMQALVSWLIALAIGVPCLVWVIATALKAAP